jgi:hypothetical protein
VRGILIRDKPKAIGQRFLAAKVRLGRNGLEKVIPIQLAHTFGQRLRQLGQKRIRPRNYTVSYLRSSEQDKNPAFSEDNLINKY